ncbi:Lysophospholipase, alpha-beta hydrolase superfamily [Mycobacterium rhizamassiliense]|jgi:pimeloyl-ACP methyl ester carboxylesterase|uniref:Lysophospholipase, alpha-beta hydrolase superfamily n=1 Tax=Mycobacterium rhizamassiliense TaxID=1841860 RepID=A0A2U3P169_9MYCO|nr:alpha/beta fold hydrolase [Mycobacterium rhizamassiliense]SPM37477.1 Lysophospholipase, alpha-beta hydrolase superfamily [Mycobacterium rhizamassiliense]
MTNHVIAPDGVSLAVHAYTGIDPRRPTILAIHGWPDNHHLWDAVADEFTQHYAGRYNVVAYDVRGAGESSRPAKRSGYEFAHVVADVGAVIDSLGVDRVHLLAHDWGSIQAWAAVTDESVMGKVASFTSVSGPHLQYAGAFLRSVRGLRSLGQVIRQLLASAYIGFFLCPLVPELSFHSRIGVAVVALAERIGGAGTRRQRPRAPRSIDDYLNGLNLYRANMVGSLLSRELPTTDVAIQVLVPRWDLFVTPALQRFTGAIPAGSNVVPIEGGHWVVTSHPAVIAGLAAQWVDRNTDGAIERHLP